MKQNCQNIPAISQPTQVYEDQDAQTLTLH